jgi:photosystem II stability/assembly factor-like uncharacterized protein
VPPTVTPSPPRPDERPDVDELIQELQALIEEARNRARRRRRFTAAVVVALVAAGAAAFLWSGGDAPTLSRSGAAAAPAAAAADRWSTPTSPYGGFVIALAADPRRPATLYASVLFGGVFKTADGGAHWRRIGPTSRAFRIDTLTIDAGGTLYAGGSQGVYVTSDGGRHWRGGAKGIVSHDSTIHRLAEGQVYGIAVDSQDPGAVYASTYGELFKSTDGARTWRPLHAFGKYTVLGGLISDPRRPGVLHAVGVQPGGIYTSTSGGRTWRLEFLPGEHVARFAISPGDSQTMVAATTHGELLVTHDGGVSWERGRRLTGQVNALTLDAGGVLAVGTNRGIFISDDSGATWKSAPVSDVYSLVLTGGTIYAGTVRGIQKSVDGGNTWQLAATGIVGASVNTLAVRGRTVVGGTYAGGSLASTDGGRHWRRTSREQAVSVSVTPTRLYLGTWGNGLWASRDHGSTWQALTKGLAAQRIGGLSVDPSDDDIVLAGTSRGIFRTTDAGDTWHATNVRTQIRTLAAFAGEAYAGTNNGSIWKSVDRGLTWTASARVYGQVFSIARAADGTLYASTWSAVFRSDDGAASWQRLARPTPTSQAYSLLCLGDTVYAALDQAGVARSTDGGHTWHLWNKGLRSGVLALATDGRTIYAGTAGSGIVRRTP